MSTITVESGLRRAVGWGLALAVLWLAVVFLRNETTLHLAPLLVAGSPPVLNGLDVSSAPTRRSVNTAAVAGLVIAATATLVLIASGNLDGPAIEPFSSVLVETVVLAGLGSAAGLLIGLTRVRR